MMEWEEGKKRENINGAGSVKWKTDSDCEIVFTLRVQLVLKRNTPPNTWRAQSLLKCRWKTKTPITAIFIVVFFCSAPSDEDEHFSAPCPGLILLCKCGDMWRKKRRKKSSSRLWLNNLLNVRADLVSLHSSPNVSLISLLLLKQ